MQSRILAGLLLVVFAGLGTACATRPSNTPGDAAGVSDPSGTRLLGVPDAPVVLAVFKEERELVVLRDGVPQETYPVRLGTSPRGHKTTRGDNRTPEGTYRVCTIKPSRFQKFMWISYPNEEDARRALEEGRLTGVEYERIVAALERGECPPADTALGGLTGIHGDYEEPPRRYDWTQGCIALDRNEHLIQLASLVRPGTPVVIFP
jgi:hypothetical protein